MTPTVVLPVVIGGLYAAGVYLLLDRSLTRVLLGFLLLGNATNLLLLSSGGPAGLAPILGYAEPEEMSDPLPQALILTAIVITFGLAAFLLAIIYRSWRLVRQEVVEVDEEDRRVARRSSMDADDIDPDDIDPDDLAPEDRPAMHADTYAGDGDADVERRMARHYAGIPSDDVDLPPTRRRGG
jgi:multicomponent Na+:H+ antiporter subunit C